MARTKTSTAKPKVHVLTPDELELADGLHKAMFGKATAEAALIACRREVGRLTQEINKLGYARAVVVWAEARGKLGGRS